MSDLVKIGRGSWVSRDQIARVIHVTAFEGCEKSHIRPYVRIKFPDHETSWEFDTYEKAEEFASAMVDRLAAVAQQHQATEQ